MIKRVLYSAVVAAVFAAVIVACGDDSEIGTPLMVEITGPTTGLVGEDLPFMYDVSGRSISGLIFLWGDGFRDSIAAAGAQTARGTTFHAYDSVGTYNVLLQVEDAIEGVGTDEVTVQVQGN